MAYSEKSAIVSKDASFSDVLDETCERLIDKQLQYSIRRIHEMDGRLAALEHELDEFLLVKNGA
jgi:hypothetical protein